MAKIIDGKAIAKGIRDQIKLDVAKLISERGIQPKLSVILVGDDPASLIYVRNKEKAAAEAGMSSETHRIPPSIKQNEAIDLVRSLNRDPSVHGILVQLPLPKHLNSEPILEQIYPEKDIDGIHPANLGKLFRGGNPLFTPCTPSGIIELILSTGADISGKEAVVVGRSAIVGKPTAILLLNRHATVTIAHSRTGDLGSVCRRADILVAAVGSPNLINVNMVKDGVIIIDVGVNRVGDKLVGDVDYGSVKDKASFITPVPGGVGPMTIAMLLRNTLSAAVMACPDVRRG